MRRSVLLSVLAALLGAAALAAEPAQPASPPTAGVAAKLKHDASISAAGEANRKAVIAADQQYIADLDAALSQAMTRKDVDSIRALDDQRRAAQDLLNQHQTDTDDGDVIPAAELVHYTCDSIAGSSIFDASGHNNTAMLDGSYDWVPASDGNVLRLTGGYARLPVGIVSGLNDFTIAIWVKLDSLDTWSRIFDFSNNSDVYMILTPQSGIHGLPFFEITDRGEPAKKRIYGSTPIAPGAWTHLAVVLSGNRGTLYINGDVAGANANMTVHPSSLHNTINNYIGKSAFPQDPVLKGCIDDFRIYGQALSAAQIRASAVRTERHAK